MAEGAVASAERIIQRELLLGEDFLEGWAPGREEERRTKSEFMTPVTHRATDKQRMDKQTDKQRMDKQRMDKQTDKEPGSSPEEIHSLHIVHHENV